MFLSGHFSAPCTPWGCARLVWLVGVSGDFMYLPVVSGALAVGGVKNAGLRAKPEVLGNTVAALLKRRLLPVRVLGADTRRIGRSVENPGISYSDILILIPDSRTVYDLIFTLFILLTLSR